MFYADTLNLEKCTMHDFGHKICMNNKNTIVFIKQIYDIFSCIVIPFVVLIFCCCCYWSILEHIPEHVQNMS